MANFFFSSRRVAAAFFSATQACSTYGIIIGLVKDFMGFNGIVMG
jgi:hypothetical protein